MHACDEKTIYNGKNPRGKTQDLFIKIKKVVLFNLFVVN
jgi:hypothetical protein